MQNTNPIKISISTYLGIFFLCLLFVAIYLSDTIFQYTLELTHESEIRAKDVEINKVKEKLVSLRNIELNVTPLNSIYFTTITPLTSFPIDAQTLTNFGKANPFIGSFNLVTEQDRSSVGGLIFSGQREELNNGNAIRAVPAQ